MRKQAPGFETKSLMCGSIIDDVELGRLILPDFQRDFVWDPSRVTELLDSVSRGWPVGALLLLHGPQPFGFKEFEFGPSVDLSRPRTYLLDGQQRVTALWLAIKDIGDTVYYVDFDSPDEREEFPFQGISRKRWKSGPGRFTFAELIDDAAFSLRIRDLPSRLANRYTYAREGRVGENLRSYEIPAIVMERDVSLEALTRIFETLNRTGLRLSAFDLMVAVLRRNDFMLREEWERAKVAHPVLDRLDADGLEVLKLVALWRRDSELEGAVRSGRRVTGVRQGDVLNVPGEFVARVWGRAVGAYSAALELLEARAGVLEKSSMPSWSMVLPMAYWIDSQVEFDTLIRWYWASVAQQTYAQGANTQVITDVNRGPGWVRRIDMPDVAARLRIAMLEPARRSRVLRLGLRGLAFTRARRTPLEPGGREISLELLAQGRVAYDAAAPLADIVYVPPAILADLRKSPSLQSLAALAREQYAEMFGFVDFASPVPQRRIDRASAVVNIFTEVVA